MSTVLNLFAAMVANPNTYGVIASSQGSLALVVQKINELVYVHSLAFWDCLKP